MRTFLHGQHTNQHPRSRRYAIESLSDGSIGKLAFKRLCRSTFCQRDLLCNHVKQKQCQIKIVDGDVCIILILFQKRVNLYCIKLRRLQWLTHRALFIRLDLRTFAPKTFPRSDFFFKLATQKGNDLLLSKRQKKKGGVTVLVFEIMRCIFRRLRYLAYTCQQ